MAVTDVQRERLKKALFYAGQNPDEAVEAIISIIEGASSGSSITIDSSLTQSGQAADAKATGDAVAKKFTKPSSNGTSGQILTSDGSETPVWKDAPAEFTKMPLQSDSTATGQDVDTLKTDFNSLLGKLKTAGLMADA